jgi:hypothetical protein
MMSNFKQLSDKVFFIHHRGAHEDNVWITKHVGGARSAMNPLRTSMLDVVRADIAK